MIALDADYNAEVEKLLGDIAKNKSLLARGYSAKREANYTESEEPEIQALRSLGLVRPVGDRQFRLSKQLRDIINKGVNRRHLRDINVNLGEYTDSLEVAVEDYLNAKKSLNEDDIENATDELISAFYEVGDFFSDASSEIDQQVKLAIGNQAYGQKRISVIKGYLLKLDQLQQAHETITLLFSDEIYSEESLLSDEKIKFLGRTIKYIDQVKSTHQEIRTVLHMRQVREKRTQQLRALDAYLMDNPTAELNKSQERAVESPWYRVPEPIMVNSFVDLQSNDDSLLEMYEKEIESLSKRKPKEKDNFVRPSSGETKSQILAREAVKSNSMLIINDTIKKVIQDKCIASMVKEKEKHSAGDDIENSYWLYISRVHPLRLILEPRVSKHLKVTPVYAPYSDVDGNRTVIDTLISHRSVSNSDISKFKDAL